jgi:tRNA (cmo5U34)-methyltransferase
LVAHSRLRYTRAMSVGRTFGRDAEIYDRTRRQLVPCFDDFYRVAVERLAPRRDHPVEVLDLGAGTGLFAAMVAEALPQARLTLVDASAEMLARARQRLGAESRFRFVVADFRQPLPDGSFDAVVSALAIHHLDDGEKRDLFRRIHAALRPGGVFVNADQVMGPTPELESAYREAWLGRVRAAGVAEADLTAALERMKEDRTSPLEPQLEWLRQAGFARVDSWYKFYRFAVYSGDLLPSPACGGG